MPDPEQAVHSVEHGIGPCRSKHPNHTCDLQAAGDFPVIRSIRQRRLISSTHCAGGGVSNSDPMHIWLHLRATCPCEANLPLALCVTLPKFKSCRPHPREQRAHKWCKSACITSACGRASSSSCAPTPPCPHTSPPDQGAHDVIRTRLPAHGDIPTPQIPSPDPWTQLATQLSVCHTTCEHPETPPVTRTHAHTPPPSTQTSSLPVTPWHRLCSAQRMAPAPCHVSSAHTVPPLPPTLHGRVTAPPCDPSSSTSPNLPPKNPPSRVLPLGTGG